MCDLLVSGSNGCDGGPVPGYANGRVLTRLYRRLNVVSRLSDMISGAVIESACVPCVASRFVTHTRNSHPRVMPRNYAGLNLMKRFIRAEGSMMFAIRDSIHATEITMCDLLGVGGRMPSVSPSRCSVHRLLQTTGALGSNGKFVKRNLLHGLLGSACCRRVLPPARLSDGRRAGHGSSIFSRC